MVQYQQDQVDRAFGALADSNRRAVLEQLAHGTATISELAAPLDMTLTGMKKHVAVLEEANLVTTEKVGRQRVVSLDPRGPVDAAAWMEMHRAMTEARLDRLEELIKRQRTNRKEPK